MSEQDHNTKWEIIGQSVVGALHMKSQIPRQDAIVWDDVPDGPVRLIVAVADGHGHELHFRSAVGAQIAVEVAKSTLKLYMKKKIDLKNITAFKNRIQDSLPRTLSKTWRNKVTEHLNKNPFSPQDKDRIIQHLTLDGWSEIENDPMVAYGTTLLVTAVADFGIIYAQIGDGNIITIDESNGINEPLNIEDTTGSQTDSLCMPESWRYFYVVFQTYYQHLPLLILLCTDGYRKSFSLKAKFLEIAPFYLNWIRSEGISVVKTKLAEELSKTSNEGSQDDITLAIVYRTSTEKTSTEKTSTEKTSTADIKDDDDIEPNKS